VLKEYCSGKTDMPDRFFTRSLSRVVFKEGIQRQTPGVIIVKDGTKMTLFCENQKFVEVSEPEKAIFYWVCIHYCLNLQLSDTFKQKNDGFLGNFFTV